MAEEESKGFFESLQTTLGTVGETIISGAETFQVVKKTIDGTTKPVTNVADASAAALDPAMGSTGAVVPPTPPPDPSEITQFFNRNLVPIIVGIISVLTLGGLFALVRGK